MTLPITFFIQVNNAFGDQQNAELPYLTRPRFGQIRGIRSIRTIQKCQEIFVIV